MDQNLTETDEDKDEPNCTPWNQGRAKDNRFRDFYFFATTVMPPVIGVKRWDNKATRHSLLQEVATGTDEAFALLCLENYEAKWRSQYKKKTQEQAIQNGLLSSAGPSSDGEMVNAKYTLGQIGWSEEGLTRFNELNETVNQGRALGDSKLWDKAYKAVRVFDYYNKDRGNTLTQATKPCSKRTYAACNVPYDKDALDAILFD
jgi:hypothetical protein